MKRTLDAHQNSENEYDHESHRELLRQRCMFNPGNFLRSDKQNADGCGSQGYTEETSESDAGDSDKDNVEVKSGYVGGILSSRVCKSKIPRWRMRKFMFISFKEEGPHPDFLGCPEWAKPMLTVYYQVG